VGFLAPAIVFGLGAMGPAEGLVVAAYVGLTALALVLAWIGRGLGRWAGAAIVAGYVLFAILLATW
jgi:hypothetical protein